MEKLKSDGDLMVYLVNISVFLTYYCALLRANAFVIHYLLAPSILSLPFTIDNSAPPERAMQ